MGCGAAWKIPGMPRSGWRCTSVVDLNPADLPSDEVDYGTCGACENHPIRFVHTIEHEYWPVTYDVGVVCAGHLTSDAAGAREREGELKRASARRTRWPNLKWMTSAKGNLWLKHRGVRVVIVESWPDLFSFAVDGVWDCRKFASQRAAVLASFDSVNQPAHQRSFLKT
jgi:hypothetical protein